jgi:hypothetical protein
MIDLPKSTMVGKFIAKEKFYAKAAISAKLRQLFIAEVERITWLNKIAPATLNITSKDYLEIQVIEILLKSNKLSDDVLKQIDASIPYPILFILSFGGAQMAAISYKEPLANKLNQMKIESYFKTSRQPELTLTIKGLSVDEIYKNLLLQIEPKLKETLHANIKSIVTIHKNNLTIQKQLEALNKKIRNEPSISKKQELARQRAQLKQQENGV